MNVRIGRCVWCGCQAALFQGGLCIGCEAPTVTPANATGERLRFLRLSVGLTQAELAQRAGMQQNDVSMAEAGYRHLGRERMTRLTAALSQAAA